MHFPTNPLPSCSNWCTAPRTLQAVVPPLPAAQPRPKPPPGDSAEALQPEQEEREQQ